MTFLKNRYLARGIKHVAGALNFLVIVDGQLVGGFIYANSSNASEMAISSIS